MRLPEQSFFIAAAVFVFVAVISMVFAALVVL